METKERLIYILFAISAIGVLPFAQWLVLAPYGSGFFLSIIVTYLFLFLFVAVVLALPVLLVRICYSRYRARSLPWLLLCLFYLPCFVVGTSLEKQVWVSEWEALAERSQPLIRAIKQFEQDQGAPPTELGELVPDYLPAVPDTGIRACSEYRYYAGEIARNQYAGNPWVLWFPAPVFGVGFDEMLYFPKQNYPKRGYGGSLERVGDWAYVHE